LEGLEVDLLGVPSAVPWVCPEGVLLVLLCIAHVLCLSLAGEAIQGFVAVKMGDDWPSCLYVHCSSVEPSAAAG